MIGWKYEECTMHTHHTSIYNILVLDEEKPWTDTQFFNVTILAK